MNVKGEKKKKEKIHTHAKRKIVVDVDSLGREVLAVAVMVVSRWTLGEGSSRDSENTNGQNCHFVSRAR